MADPPRSPARVGPHAEAARRSVFDLVSGAIGKTPAAPVTPSAPGADAVMAALHDSAGAAAKPSEHRGGIAIEREGKLGLRGYRQQPPQCMDAAAQPISSEPSVPLPRARPVPVANSGYSRKDKSLGVLCEKFIEQYGNGPGSKISLDTASTTLSVERRRIYDIINVLECLGCVSREAKNVYAWNTMQHLLDKLDELKSGRTKASASPRDPSLPVALTPDAAAAGAAAASAAAIAARSQLSSSAKVPLQALKIDSNAENIGLGSSGGGASVAEAHGKSSSGGTRKDKSLGILCQKFVQLFLVSSNHTVGLDEAATQLSDGTPSAAALRNVYLSKEETAKLLKTKVRRLYDIANVLTSLCLIEKVSLRTRKPCFRWTGVSGNKALQTLRGEPRHPSALARPRPKFRQVPGSSSKPTPTLKRRISSANEARSAPAAAPPKGKRGPKRRKIANAGEGSRAPSPNAVKEHLPPQFTAIFKHFVTYAEENGNINPLDAANAIANATKAASVAASLKPAAAQTRDSHDVVTKRQEPVPAATRPSGLRQPLSSPMSTSDGGGDDFQVSSKTNLVSVRHLSTMEGEGTADGENTQYPSHATTRMNASPLNSVSKRDRGGSAFAHSTPKRLMAAQQLSALSQTLLCDATDTAVPRQALNSEDGASPRRDLIEAVATGSKTMSQTVPTSTPKSVDNREPAAHTPVAPSLAQSNMYRYTTPEAIDEYMAKARAAGPEYEVAANDWLATVRKWQSSWGPRSTNLKRSPSSAPSPVTPAGNLNLSGQTLGRPGTHPAALPDSESPNQPSPGKAGGP